MALDAVIIGGGHNGLVCAFYLARAGHKVRICEAHHTVGGAAVTEEFHPGFRNSVASYTVSLLQPKVIAEMALERRGLRVVNRPVANFLPLSPTPGDYLLMGGGLERSQAEVAKFSRKDAATLPAYFAALDRVADVLRALALKIPPRTDGLRGLIDAALQSRVLKDLDVAGKREALALFTRSAREYLDGWLESDPIKAAFGFDAVVGNYASPDAPGSGYVLLHHVFGESNAVRGAWGHAIGGMGAITQAMAAACHEAGVEIGVEQPVAEVLVERGAAVGVHLANGEEVRAKRVIANVGPALLYRKLIPRAALPDDFAVAMDRYATGSGSLRMNLALSALPSFAALPGPGEHLSAGIIMAPSLDYMDRAFDDAKRFGWSRAPVVEMLIPSTVDSTLVDRQGSHVASLFCQQFDPKLEWTAAQEAAAVEAVLTVLEGHAPGVRDLIVAQQVLTPKGLERRFGLVDGDIFHGRMSLDQLWAARPVLGTGSHRGPIPGLWLCGSGAHPGGGVTGAPGHNCAAAVLKAGRKV
ncbi:NAD(P)/FAD-dependent oxidoreductase [Novosphingobium sp. Gsoil 351]|uniref:phytoene desaturase family protein n=1 Tax=Novosphingobium sp. Gsoil 351 TaxID=2675225 RepID=UPI0012B4E91C|nr:NAD(P)/FAD-dependent oxidoreductase [Novosphingobium sp. Gsoil 351]QGN55151.1 FAD-dependent oxidoreductase [Novosphingobium sp. Gsoil 351]